MKTMSQIASGLYKSLTEVDNKKPKPYDTKAEVIRIEDDIVWVKFPGGEDETPVSKTNNATPGDQVMVRVSGGRAWVLGNETNPSTDDTTANKAFDEALIANKAAGLAIESANEAVESSGIAKTASEQAQIASEVAKEAAESAISDADSANAAAIEAKEAAEVAASDAMNASIAANNAETSAEIANTMAEQAVLSSQAATYHLSEVEDVLGVLNWISSHVSEDSYVLTEDTEIKPGKWYFKPSPTGGFIADSPISNPAEELFYEISSLDDTVTNYINTHLFLDNGGLHIRKADGGSQVIISSNAIEMYDSFGNIIAKYTDEIVLGDSEKTNVRLSPTDGLQFRNGQYVVASIDQNILVIKNARLDNSLKIGDFTWRVINTNRVSLIYDP